MFGHHVTNAPLQINSKLIRIVMWVYPAVWVALVCYEIHVVLSVNLSDPKIGRDFMYSVIFLVINPLAGNELLWMLFPGMQTKAIPYIILLGIPFVVPAILTAVCAVLIYVSLVRRRTTTDITRRQKQKISITVLQLTVSSLLFSCLYFITELTFAFCTHKYFRYEYYLLYFTANVSVFLNSVIKPCILFTRGTSLRKYLLSTLSLTKGL